ncbi:MAG TPA: UDP-N-acetylmuramate--L-alanine ligase [Dokdonella sp.]|uniref:UDP-N-acetylmuramate--L-alanine ligase n=1 Tax=Dokdonella sp. TaxID=2291710 RepID=UPI0025BB7853|nr:UDP-N-acetylmuramate--L-alanine ligase [Dokdonella sp.]MBX3690842.1 UDP-N-acetylmuramate--L-alanine ligase [Dokdonella sp.]HNR91422.1 UDP-N-acetylmuramate--L-alanine ligase [Dokdonella sp.]
MTPQRLRQHGDIMQDFRHVHFVGIGGVGMSGIAEVLHNLGYAVSGSDRADSPTTRRLAGLGIDVRRGHAAAHVEDIDVLVVSSAIADDNPELLAARERRIPVVPRAEMLGELMRFRRGIAVAGTHGKTTTTSLTASVLAEAGLDPTFVIGGQLTAAGANARLGTGEYLVAEADESDGSFLMLAPVIAIVTNIDADHLENYDGDFARVKQAFEAFLHRLPFYGVAVLCIDDPEVAALAALTPRRTLTCGIDSAADVRASNLRQDGARMHFDLHLPDADEAVPVKLNLPGRHNVQNALAACAVGWQLGVSAAAMQTALAAFQGVGRRFTLRGEVALDRGKVLLVDDYGHHPSELAAVFAAARGGWPGHRLVVAFQPHRYSRTRDLLDDFARVLADVDVLVLTEVYPAGEAPIANADGRALARAVRARGKVDPVLVEHPRDLRATLPTLLADGDLLLLLGAGDIGATAAELASVGQLKSQGGGR